MTFRFDDVCINADMELIQKMTDWMISNFNCQVIWGVSPMVHNTGDQRIFPRIFHAYSDQRHYYKVDKVGIPEIDPRVIPAGHGLIHIDHRLLSRETQELSILASCSLVKANTFIPPFNKWNKDTEEICQEHNIDLIRFENGWLCMEYNEFKQDQKLWYLHAREWTFEKFVAWFQK